MSPGATLEGARIGIGFPERLRAEAAALYLEAFGRKLGPILGRGERAAGFIAAALRPAYAVAAIGADGRLLGLAGVRDETGGLIGGGREELARAYGGFGALWRGAAARVFEREAGANELLIDAVAVTAGARGRGIGGALIERAAAWARETGRRELRLEVTDAAPRARALYQRRGFAVTAETDARFLGPIFGFASVATMVRRV